MGGAQKTAGLAITKPLIIKGVKAGADARDRSVTGLGNAAYTGANDAAESNVFGTDNYATIIFIGASDVTLDGLTINVKSGKKVKYSIGIIAATGQDVARVKVTNCVIRHLSSSSTALYGILIQSSGGITDTEISFNEIRDYKEDGSSATHGINVDHNGAGTTAGLIKRTHL